MSSSALTIPRFITIWILIAGLVVTWDAGYVLNRPHSMAGGYLFWLFQPYAKYITLDLLYGNTQNSFVVAQSWLNVLEILLGFFSLAMYHYSKSSTKKNLACLLLLITCVATFAKTVLYFCHDIVDMGIHPDQHPKDISWFDYIMLFIVPNIIWIVVPFSCIAHLTKQILAVCERVQPKAAKANKTH